MRKFYLYTILLLFNFNYINAQNVQFTASAPKSVGVGEQFEITYTLNYQPSGFKLPESKNLSLLSGPNISFSSNDEMIGNKVVHNSSYSYIYILSANNPGTINLEPAQATVNGKSYSSNSLTIEVVKSGNAPKNNSQGNVNINAGNSQASIDVGNEDVFVRIIPDMNSVNQGEGFKVSIKLYFRLQISIESGPENFNLDNFFRQDIDLGMIQKQQENINGRSYSTAVIQKFVLFPQKSGEIVINPFSMKVLVQVPIRNRRPSVFDDFFGPQVQEVEKKISSLPVKIFVKPLPANGPLSFHGAVGEYNFKTSIDKQNVKTNDAINLKLSISGNGNIKMIGPLDIKFPTDFETYDPKISVNTNVTNAGVTGSKTFEYLVIPRHSGNFKIPSIEFSYFDLKSKQYKTLSSGELEINVEKSENEGTTNVISGVGKEDVKFLGKDIQFIMTRVPVFTRTGDFLFGSLGFCLYFIISFVLFVILVLLWRKRIRENANIVLVRNKRANKIARMRLKDAHLYMTENKKEGFYEYILKALWGYMSDKLSIPVAELSREKVLEETSNKKIETDIIKKFLEILDTCEYARYAPIEDNTQMDSVYKDAITVISQIEQKMK
jgi:BatD DUF11 like domain